MMLRDPTFKQLCSKTAQVLGGMRMSESSRKETMPSNVAKGWCLSGKEIEIERHNGHFPELRVLKGRDLQRSVLSCCLLHCKPLTYIKPAFLVHRTNINRTLSSKEVISTKQDPREWNRDKGEIQTITRSRPQQNQKFIIGCSWEKCWVFCEPPWMTGPQGILPYVGQDLKLKLIWLWGWDGHGLVCMCLPD